MIEEYDVVILSEVWRSHFSVDQISELVDFIEGGGGFIMFGGYGGFGGMKSTADGAAPSSRISSRSK